MSLRPNLRTACRALALRSRPLPPRQEPLVWAATKRGYSDELRKAERSQIPTLKATENAAFPHGQEVPDSAPGQKQPTNEAIEAAAALSELAEAAKGQGSGIEGGLTEAQEQTLYAEGAIPPTQSNGDGLRDLEILASGGIIAQVGDAEVATSQPRTYKFPLPTLPLPPHSHLKSRYHPVLDQLTNLMMRDGKKAQAQRNMAMVLNFLRTSPPPIVNPRYPLLPGAPPPAHLPLNPVLYLTLAVDSVAPLIKIRRIAGGAGGGRPLELPAPLAVRQRRRAAFQWILDVVNKKSSKGSGRTQFAHRVADELIAVAEGRSSVWEKRLAMHKLGTTTRANLNVRVVKQH
ncbi:30S ribosomal protein S7 [Colletotrichum orchidophilum]|uniref:Small ribosomal subunit protein uS7m n=1 Tax=Colletotrichum orchidophilum TaxID=1209926 RepID=A0A1G4BFR6_9PEZI|nr:30S ribosomal protein S7 [Colletotrichum orchidophilum]OHF00234.1 30S ribosomal protein S7 [Colletotrichum orchidophilum]